MPPKNNFHKPFNEQIEAIKTRTGNQIPTARWDDMQANAHDRAFTVAGAMKADLLADFANSVESYITEGKSIEDFRADFDQIVDKHGWQYTGERNWRTRVIYGTNMRTSYASGRLAQLRDPELQEVAPFWMYVHGGSADPRPDHLSWDGLVLPANDPWWRIHYPPNGWGCSCSVVAVSEETARRQGGRFEDPPPDTETSIDKGWDYMPGANVQTEIRENLQNKANKLPMPLGASLLIDAATSQAFKEWLKDPTDNWPLVKLPVDDLKAIGSRNSIAMLSRDTAIKQNQRHPELTVKDYQKAQTVVQSPSHRIQQGDRTMIYARENTRGGYVLVVKATKTGEGLFVTSYRRLSANEAKRDKEIKRLLDKGKI